MADVVTKIGKRRTAEIVGGIGTVNPFKYMALGTGTGGALDTNTTLGTEITSGGGNRKLADSITTTGTDNNVLTLTATWNFTSSFAVTESGVFNAASAGDMYCRSNFSAYNVVSGDSIQLTAKVTYS